jgi:hypothetical protein
LELPVTCPLRQVTCDHDPIWSQVGEHLLERLDLLERRQRTEVEVGEVEQLDGHDSACTV